MPTVTVLHFAVLRERRGVRQEAQEVEAGTTVVQLYDRLFPAGPQVRLPVGYAVNQCYVGAEHELLDGDEVAFIPPVGGG